MAKLRLGALEAGGTKMVCAIGDENGTIYEKVSIPTTTPKETIPKMIAYFRDKGIDALGIACFGPIELDRDSENTVISQPRQSWPGGTAILWGRCRRHFIAPWDSIQM